MSEDEDDPVVQEIPVHLSHSLADQLYIFQYPVIPASHPSEKYQIIKSRIKPEHQEIALEVGIETNNTNYDSSHGELIAKTVDKDKPNDGRIFPRKIMDRLHMESNRSMVNTDSYCIGIMQGQELYLTPLKGLISMLPSFLHLNQPKQEDEMVEEKLVRLDLGAPERAKKSTRANYSVFSQKIAQEPWYTTEYFDITSAKAELERSRLCSRVSSSGEIVKLSKEGYLDNLVPKEQTSESGPVPLPEHVLSLNILRQFPLQERVRLVLKEVMVVPLQQLTWIVGGESERVLQCVQQIAVLVQGNWVLRSDMLYPKDARSPHNGVPSEAMARARDYILYQLNEGTVLERKNLAFVVKIPNEELKDIMSQVAVLKKNQSWHFRLPPDNEFLTKHPSIVEQQKMMWEAKYNQLMETLGFGFGSPKAKKKKESGGESRKRTSSSMSSDGEVKEDGGEEVPPAPTGGKVTKTKKKNTPVLETNSNKTSCRRRKKGEIQVNGECVLKVEPPGDAEAPPPEPVSAKAKAKQKT